MIRTRKVSKKNKGTVNLFILLIIIALLAVISYVVSFLFINDASEEQQMITKRPNQLTEEELPDGEVKIITPINGRWYSTYDGAMLSVDGTSFTLEIPSVDASKIVNGTLSLSGDEVVFKYNESSKNCSGKPGKYYWKMQGQDKLVFKMINDDCSARAERMSSVWERF